MFIVGKSFFSETLSKFNIKTIAPLCAGHLRLTLTGIAILISKEKNLMREMFSTWHVLPALGRSILPWLCLVTWATCCACPAGQSWPWPGTISLSSECKGIRWTWSSISRKTTVWLCRHRDLIIMRFCHKDTEGAVFMHFLGVFIVYFIDSVRSVLST